VGWAVIQVTRFGVIVVTAAAMAAFAVVEGCDARVPAAGRDLEEMTYPSVLALAAIGLDAVRDPDSRSEWAARAVPGQWRSQMNSTPYLQAVNTLAAIAERERQLREIKGLVDRSLDRMTKFWPVAPLLVAGWIYLVTDEDRFEAFAGMAENLARAVPVQEIAGWIGA
jgi:hypothetical protein